MPGIDWATERLTLILYLTPMVAEYYSYNKGPEYQENMWLTQQNIIAQFTGAKYKNFYVFLKLSEVVQPRTR